MPRTYDFTIRPWQEADLPALVAIWNQVVEDGVAFPQEDLLTEEAGRAFFAAQSRTAVAVTPRRGGARPLHSPPEQHRPLRPHRQRQLCGAPGRPGPPCRRGAGPGQPGRRPGLRFPCDAV